MSREPEALAGEEFVFRLDQPLPARLFGARLQVTGWLLHRAGRPIHGIRALVDRTFHRPRVIKARRKRSRPDAEAAFPDLAGAKVERLFRGNSLLVRPARGPAAGAG